MNKELFQYLEIDSIGITLLLILLFYILFVYKEVGSIQIKPFVGLLICNVFILTLDCVIYLLEGHSSQYVINVSYLLCCVYYILHPVFGVLWYWYTFRKLFPEKKMGRRRIIALIIPLCLCSLLICSSPFNHLFFYMTEHNQYVRGEYLYVIIGLSVLYWILSAGLTLKELIGKRRVRENGVFVSLLLYPIPTLIGNIIQMVHNGVTFVWVCSAVSSIILFINIQGYQLSHDMMTGVFNRAKARKQINWEIKNLKQKKDRLFIAMIDVDRFKQINDTFGHVIGDHALMTIAEILRMSCREKDFVARIGGDEFLLLGHIQGEEEVIRIISIIEENISVSNSSDLYPFNLSLSIGYELYDAQEERSVDTVISAADYKMYAQKRRKG